MARMQHPLVPQVRFVSLMRDVADQIRPGDAVGGADQPGVCDGAEGFAHVGGVGYVAVGGEEDGAEAGCVGGVTDVGIGGFSGAICEEAEGVIVSVCVCLCL